MEKLLYLGSSGSATIWHMFREAAKTILQEWKNKVNLHKEAKTKHKDFLIF